MTASTRRLPQPDEQETVLFQSPKGVTDFVEVTPQSSDKLELWNNSFSWTEYDDVRPASTPSTLSQELKQVQKRLDWIQQQSKQDRQDYNRQLFLAKQECKAQLLKKYASEGELSTATRRTDDPSTNNARGLKGLVQESGKIIRYLRQDNSRLRREMQSLQRSIRDLRQRNASLEKANELAQASHKQLETYITELMATQTKLKSHCSVYRDHWKKMKEDYAVRSLHHEVEEKTSAQYQFYLSKVLAQVKKGGELPSDGALTSSVYELAGECGLQVASAKKAELLQAGIELPKGVGTNAALKRTLFEAQLEQDDDSSSIDSDTEY